MMLGVLGSPMGEFPPAEYGGLGIVSRKMFAVFDHCSRVFIFEGVCPIVRRVGFLSDKSAPRMNLVFVPFFANESSEKVQVDIFQHSSDNNNSFLQTTTANVFRQKVTSSF